MSRPIAPTPKLRGKAARKFLETVEKDLQNPVGPVSTPKINEVIKIIMLDSDKEIKKPRITERKIT
jgi:hypothetical protein